MSVILSLSPGCRWEILLLCSGVLNEFCLISFKKQRVAPKFQVVGRTDSCFSDVIVNHTTIFQLNNKAAEQQGVLKLREWRQSLKISSANVGCCTQHLILVCALFFMLVIPTLRAGGTVFIIKTNLFFLLKVAKHAALVWGPLLTLFSHWLCYNGAKKTPLIGRLCLPLLVPTDNKQS